MKRILSFIVIFALCLGALSIVSSASDVENDALKEYVSEKIVPVVIGVLTSVCAFLATLSPVIKTLSSLKDTKESLSLENKARENELKGIRELLGSNSEELCELLKDVPSLSSELLSLRSSILLLLEECDVVEEILSLGFSASPDVVRTGKGEKIIDLLEKSKSARLSLEEYINDEGKENEKA